MPIQMPKGATLLEDDTGLKQEGITTLEQLSEAEAENILKATRTFFNRKRAFKRDWFTEEYLKKIHKKMYEDVWDWAGKYRTSMTNIGVRPYLISTEINQLIADLFYWTEQEVKMTLLEKGVRIHHRLVKIHPFINGNGRFSRLMGDYYLFLHDHPYCSWPAELIVKGDIRAKYIEALKSADFGDYTPLIALTEKYLIFS